jgi:hypothetical protein
MNKAPLRKRSGGPQTDEGKKSSSRNALKTGAYSSLIVLPGESEEDFKSLEEQFLLDFSPRDIAEATMVRSLAVITWKKLRVEKLEHARLVRELKGSFELPDYFKITANFGLHDREKILGLTRLTEPEDVPQWELAFQLAAQYQKQGATAKELDTLQKNCPLLYDQYKEEAKRIGIGDQGHEQWPTIRLKTVLGDEYDFIPHIASIFSKDFKEQEWVVKYYDALKSAVLDIQEKRLLNFVRHGSAQRVYDDLDRAFYKTLSELRRHQQWRRDMAAQDVTPSENDDA